MNKKQKLELGIEIISGMKASAYNVTIQEGRVMALNETEPSHFLSYKNGTTPECKSWEMVAKREKHLLHKQAFYMADLVLAKLKKI